MRRILLVTIGLGGRSGTEVVCFETARGLRKRGHEVSIFTHHDGPTADRLRADGIRITTDLASPLSTPELIQANQTYPLLEAIGRFPGVPAISICHDATVWYNEPIDLPSIRRHVAVDLACRARIADRFSHLGERVELLCNAVDLDRFQPRPALPERPRRALMLAKQSSYLDAVRSACARREIDVDVVGPAVGNVVDDLPLRLPDYDLVFASARSALEAMAVGCAVIVVDGRGLAGLVTHDVVPSWRLNNFGSRLLSLPVSEQSIGMEVDRYEPTDAGRVTAFIRRHSSLDGYLDRLEEMHGGVIGESAAGLTIDKDDLACRMGRSFRSLATAQQAQMQAEFQHREAGFQHRASLREAKLHAKFREWASLREAGLQAAFRERARLREAELQAEFQDRANAREAEFRAVIQSYVDWAAPRNLPRRIGRKIRRLWSGT